MADLSLLVSIGDIVRLVIAVVLPEEGFDRLRRALLGSLFLKRAVPSAVCVDNRLAEAAITAVA